MHIQVRLGDTAFNLEAENETFRLNGEPLDAHFKGLSDTSGLLFLDGHTHVVSFEENGEKMRVTVGGISQDLIIKGETALLLERFGFDELDSTAEREVRAPMPGLVLQVLVEAGQMVEEGNGLLVLEAMKMENELRAPRAGRVESIHVAQGEAVGKNALLIVLDA